MACDSINVAARRGVCKQAKDWSLVRLTLILLPCIVRILGGFSALRREANETRTQGTFIFQDWFHRFQLIRLESAPAGDREGVTKDMSSPRVSVIVPVYDVEQYVAQCLDSLVNQTLADIEIIVVNDCSPDGSESIVLEYQERDARLKYIKHERNKGLGGARNTGIAAALGEYVAFVDSDDWLREDALRCVYDRCIEDQADVGLFAALDYFEETDTFETTGYSAVRVPRRFTVSPATLQLVCAAAWTKLYRRDLLVASGVLFPEKLFHEDEEFFFCFFSKTEPVVTALKEELYFYRRRRASIMGGQGSVLRDVPAILSNTWDFLVANGLVARYGSLFRERLRWFADERLPSLDFEAQSPFYSGLQELLRRIDEWDTEFLAGEDFRRFIDLDYERYLASRLRDLQDLRKDPWYQFGRLTFRQKLRRSVVLLTKKLGLYAHLRAVKSRVTQAK
jgi:glycosyltransferase involved in cell wall biosynthesis